MMKQHILIPDQKTRIRLEISLPPRGIDEDIESVTLVGEFCEWDQKKGVNLVSREGIWTLGNESPLKKGDRYYFIVNDQVVYDVLEKNVEAVKKGAGLRNIYSGDKIVFDPSNYRHAVKQSTARVEGFDLHDEYNQLQEDLVTFTYDVGRLLGESSTLKTNEYTQSYLELVTKLDDMEENYDKFFSQAWLDKRMDTIVYCHPVYVEYSRLREAGDAEGETLEEFFSSERFEDFFSKHLELSKKLDPDSVLLDGEFVDTLLILGGFLEKSPSLRNKFGVTQDYLYDFLMDFVEKSPYKKLCASILFDMGSYYAHKNRREKAEYLINWLKKEYADDFYVGQGWADKVLASLKARIGSEAPDFEVKTLDGDLLRLADFRGKFVFVDFWGVWCGPCKAETPNMKRLAKEISADRLQIIGIATLDTLEVLTNYIKDNQINYPNALVSEEDDVVVKYGITVYPTTFLIDPRGIIKAKNLRGERLVDLVLEKMKEE
jgi:peroxiredoxin